MSNELGRIAELAEKHARVQTVMHHVNADTLKREHERQKTGKAVGVDKVTKEEYGKKLDENIESLAARMKTFSYRPQPVRRTYIPKEGSDKLRPLGIPAYEDKLVQGAMRNVLDAVYEKKFYDFSYGFRTGKSQHQAVKAVNDLIVFKKVNWVVDSEAREFFADLKERLAKFDLEIAEDKSRIIRFGRFARQDEAGGKTETFDFLGFTHINGKTREGKYTVAHRISKKKMKVKQTRIKEWLKFNIQDKVPDIIDNLNRKLRGLYQYYGISGNIKSLQKLDWYTKRTLRHALKRRSQRSRMTWERFNKILEQFPLTQPRIYVNIWR